VFTSSIQAMSFEEFAVNRMIYVSEKYCKFNNGITAVTPKQARNRVQAIKYWSKEFNDMYPSIHPRRTMKDVTAISEFEASFLNFDSILDDGDSFGMFSLQWDTVKDIAKRNDWEFNKIQLQNDPYYQAKYAVWYYYSQLQRKGNRYDALIAYNYPSIDENEDRWRRYFMGVLGIITYHDRLLKGE
jgi:hypothetical protein